MMNFHSTLLASGKRFNPGGLLARCVRPLGFCALLLPLAAQAGEEG